MDKQENSFDGTFQDNIRSPAYKAQMGGKKNKLVINVSGIFEVMQIHSTQWLSMWPKRINGFFKLTHSPISTSISAGLITMSSPISLPACNPTRKSTTSQVLIISNRNDHSIPQEQSRHCLDEL